MYGLCDTKVNVFKEHLSECLSCVGVCRELYYSGQLSGVPCDTLMRKLCRFCYLIFNREVTGLVSVIHAWLEYDGMPRGFGFYSHIRAVGTRKL